MKNFKKIAAVMTAAMMTAGCLAGCGSDAGSDETSAPEAAESGDAAEAADQDASAEAGGEEVTLTFWSWLPTTDQSEEMIAAFEEANPGIKIDYTRTEQDDYFEKLQVAMASGTGPDLFGLTTGPMKDQYAPFAEEMRALADANWSGWSDIISETAVEIGRAHV